MTLAFVNGHVEWKGRRVRLSRERLLLVQALARKPGEAFDFERLRTVIWGEGASVGKGPSGIRLAVRQLAYRAREQFRYVDPEFDRIEAIANVGYRWRGDAKNPTGQETLPGDNCPVVDSATGAGA